MRKESVNSEWRSGQAMPFGNKLSLLNFLLLDTQDQIQKGKKSLQCPMLQYFKITHRSGIQNNGVCAKVAEIFKDEW